MQLQINEKENDMKKFLYLMFTSFFVLAACTQRPTVNSLDQEKQALCREAVDSILSHMPEWKEVYSGYINAPFYVGGKEYSKKELSVIVVKGKDTLEIKADEYQSYSRGNSINEDSAWVGEIGRVYPYEENVAVIKRHNLLMKELFKGVPGFSLEVHDNLIQAKYVRFKPTKASNPEDYGLTDEDVRGIETDTVI